MVLFLLWLFDSLPSDVRYDENWLKTTLSQTFETTGRGEIGLFLLTFFLVCCVFWYWSFHCVGNMFVAIDVFIIEVRPGRIEPKESLITRIGILSIPGVLLKAIDVMISCSRSVAFNVYWVMLYLELRFLLCVIFKSLWRSWERSSQRSSQGS